VTPICSARQRSPWPLPSASLISGGLITRNRPTIDVDGRRWLPPEQLTPLSAAPISSSSSSVNFSFIGALQLGVPHDNRHYANKIAAVKVRACSEAASD
jgi:hypothetical protein